MTLRDFPHYFSHRDIFIFFSQLYSVWAHGNSDVCAGSFYRTKASGGGYRDRSLAEIEVCVNCINALRLHYPGVFAWKDEFLPKITPVMQTVLVMDLYEWPLKGSNEGMAEKAVALLLSDKQESGDGDCPPGFGTIPDSN